MVHSFIDFIIWTSCSLMLSRRSFFSLRILQILFILLFPFANKISRALIYELLSPSSLQTDRTPFAYRICFWILFRSARRVLFDSSPNYLTKIEQISTDKFLHFGHTDGKLSFLHILVELLDFFRMQNFLITKMLHQEFPLLWILNLGILCENLDCWSEYLQVVHFGLFQLLYDYL